MSLLVAAALALLRMQEPQTNEGAIEGTVTRYGDATPIANVEISLAPFGMINSNVGAITDASGHFILRSVLPGRYTLRAQRGGYVTPAPNGIRIDDGGSTKAVTIGTGQHLEDVRLALAPGAVVAGRVLDITGHPAIGVSVAALPLFPSNKQSGKSTETNDRGEYRIFDLEAGRYIVVAEREESSDYSVFTAQPALAEMYYPGKQRKAEAEPLELTPGTVSAGIDFTLLRTEQMPRSETFTVSGKLTGTTFSGLELDSLFLIPRPLQKPNRVWYPDSNGGEFATGKRNRLGNGKTDDESSLAFEFNDVSPGAYDLFIATGSSSDNHDCCDVVGRTRIDVSGDIRGITVVASGVNVTGKIVVKDVEAKPPLSLSLSSVPEDIRTRRIKPDPSGAFTIPRVLPGTWDLLIEGMPRELVLFDIRQDDKSVTNSGLIVGDQKAEPVQVILSACGDISGIAAGTKGDAVPAAEVLLIPTGTNESNGTLYRQTTADGAGHFTLPVVAVGEYRILALEPLRQTALQPEASANSTAARIRQVAEPHLSQGIAVTVKRGTTANVSLIAIARLSDSDEPQSAK